MKHNLIEILMNGILPNLYRERGPLIQLNVSLDERSLTTSIEFPESPAVIAVTDFNTLTPILRYSHIPETIPGYGYGQYTLITTCLIYDDEINTIYFIPYKIQNYYLLKTENDIKRSPQHKKNINYFRIGGMAPLISSDGYMIIKKDHDQQSALQIPSYLAGNSAQDYSLKDYFSETFPLNIQSNFYQKNIINLKQFHNSTPGIKSICFTISEDDIPRLDFIVPISCKAPYSLIKKILPPPILFKYFSTSEYWGIPVSPEKRETTIRFLAEKQIFATCYVPMLTSASLFYSQRNNHNHFVPPTIPHTRLQVYPISFFTALNQPHHSNLPLILPSVHILMFVKNEADHISSSLISVFQQSYDNFLLIIIDDHSDDHTSMRINQYLEANPEHGEKIHFIPSTDKRGSSPAKKALFRYSKNLNSNAFILWHCAENRMTDREFIQNIVFQMIRSQADIGAFNYSIAYQSHESIQYADDFIHNQIDHKKILERIYATSSHSATPTEVDIFDFDTHLWTKCFAPSIQIPKTLDYPFEDLAHMAILFEVNRITALSPTYEPIQHFFRPLHETNNHLMENLSWHIPSQLQHFFELILQMTIQSHEKFPILIQATMYVHRNFSYFSKLIEKLVQHHFIDKTTYIEFQCIWDDKRALMDQHLQSFHTQFRGISR